MLQALVRDGMPPAAAIRAATVNAAEVLGWSDRVGSLEAGHFADIIAVRGDVLKHIDLLSRVDVVIRHGVRYK